MMKHCGILALTSLLCASSVLSPAQTSLAFGAKTGLNFGTLSYDQDLYQGAQGITKGGVLAFMVAATGELSIANMFAVQMEPGYNSKATKWEDTQGGNRTISASMLVCSFLQ